MLTTTTPTTACTGSVYTSIDKQDAGEEEMGVDVIHSNITTVVDKS